MEQFKKIPEELIIESSDEYWKKIEEENIKIWYEILNIIRLDTAWLPWDSIHLDCIEWLKELWILDNDLIEIWNWIWWDIQKIEFVQELHILSIRNINLIKIWKLIWWDIEKFKRIQI